MAWHPGDLKPSVQVLFNKHIHAPILWPVVVEEAIKQGERDANVLANIVFYLHHPDLIPQGGLKPEQKNFAALSAEWVGWKKFVQPMIAQLSKPGTSAPSAWDKYENSNYPDASYLSRGVKQWLAKPPTHDREAGIFETGRTDGGRKLMFLAWKTLDTKRNCRDHGLHDGDGLHGFIELETSLAAVKRNHDLKSDWISILGNDAGGKGIALMHLGMNKFMFHYVFKEGICVRLAKNTAKRKLHQEGKAIFELVNSVVSGASGAKSSGGAALPPRNETTLRLSQLDWKGFIKQSVEIYKGEYGKSASVVERSSRLAIHEQVRDDKGAVIGLVRHFD